MREPRGLRGVGGRRRARPRSRHRDPGRGRPPLGGMDGMSEQRTGKATAELFEQVILRRLGAKDDDVLIGPRHGVDVGVVRVADGVAMALTADPVFIVPAYGWERARVVRGAHPRVRRRHAAASRSGGWPSTSTCPRDHRRRAHLALGRVPPGVRGHRGRRRHRPHRSVRRLHMADGRRGGRASPRARSDRFVTPTMARPGDRVMRHQRRGDRGHGAVRGHVPRTPDRGRRRRAWSHAPTRCSSR